jgi:hypothetical protein
MCRNVICTGVSRQLLSELILQGLLLQDGQVRHRAVHLLQAALQEGCGPKV